MREMKHSGVSWIGEIPADWELSKIGSLYDERSQKVSDQDYMPLSVTKQGIVPQLESTAKTDHGDSRKLIRKGDFVINSRSDRRGSCGISQYDGSCSLINTVLRPRREMSNVYFSFVFRSDLFADEFYRWGNGIVDDLWSTKWSSMKRIYIPFPPLDVQRQIATYLDAKCAKIDAVIAKQQQVIEKLKAYKLSVITEAVTKGLNPDVPMKDSGIEWIGSTPIDWKILKFGLAARVSANLVSPVDYLDYPQISPESVEKDSGRILEHKTVAEAGVISWNHLFVRGQIIYSKIRPLLNKVAIAPFDGLCSADMYPIDTENDPGFITYVMRSCYFTAQVGLVTENRVKMPKINQSELSKIMITLPPLQEQVELAEYLDKKCKRLDHVIEQKQALIEIGRAHV